MNSTAYEALSLALKPEFQTQTQHTEPPKSGQLGFEPFVLARCFDLLGITSTDKPDVTENPQSTTGLTTTQHATIPRDSELPSKLTNLIRPYFIKGIKTTQIGDVAPHVATCLMPYIQNHELEPKTLVMASIQITAAIISLMQAHAEFEKCTQAVQILKNALVFDPTFELKSCLQNAPKIPNAFKIWISQPNATIQSENTSCDLMLNALRRRQNNDPEWYSTWLRHTADTCFSTAETRSFEVFWRIEAWNDAGSTEHALELLHQFMAIDAPTLQLWFQMARLCIQTQRYGEALHALEQAQQKISSEFISPKICENLIRHFKESLGAAALSHAQNAREIEESLLELAMQFGNPETTAEAALCIYDAKLSHDIAMLEVLGQNDQARLRVVEILVERRDTDHLDALYALCLKLQKALPDAPECILLEAASQLDNPHIAAQTLKRVLYKLPQNHAIYWCAVDLWIELMTSQNAFDEAIYGIVEAFASSHPRASRALMFLMARMPKSALRMMQTIMIENLGKDAAIQAFERIKQGNANLESESSEISLPLPDTFEQSLWLLPLAWQIQYQAARLNAPPTLEEQAKAARRESVLIARGILKKKCDPAPEPAQWVHQNFGKASDAFDI